MSALEIGRIARLTGLLLALLTGYTLPAHSGSSTPRPDTSVYDCAPDYRFVVSIEQDQAWLFLPEETLQLAHVSSGSGARYSDGRNTYWSKGEEAMLDYQGRHYRDCKNDRRAAIWEQAKLSGVDFRALGNEPGWTLEISEGNRILFITDYGQRSFRFSSAASHPLQQGVGHRFEAKQGGQAIRVTLTPGPCSDTMADEQYATTVEVVLNSKRFSGCGQALH